MNLLTKIENAINFLLLKLIELFAKIIPTPIKNAFAKIHSHFQNIPAQIKNKSLGFIERTKKLFGQFQIKNQITETYKLSIAQAKIKRPQGMGKTKTFFMTPFLMVGQWLNGLSAGQSLLLLTFTSASLLSVIGIGFSGQRLLTSQNENSRVPASAIEENQYSRPDYYKKQTRHLEVSNLRLPVYFSGVNEIKSVDIDFTATLTNRSSRLFLEKHEFHLRDHLILQLEPSVANFPLEEEGKIIIRDKLLSEINDFLKLNEIEGAVTEIKIIYVLAN